MVPKKKKNGISVIRYIYMYLITAITIVLILISTIGLIRLVLNEYVFGVKDYDEISDVYWECGETEYYGDRFEPNEALRPVSKDEVKTKALTPKELEECKAEVDERRATKHANNMKRDLVNWIAMLIVALPLYLYHWGLIQRENKRKKRKK